jgi:hypothetical protein
MKYINENPTKTEKILFEKYGLYLIHNEFVAIQMPKSYTPLNHNSHLLYHIFLT